MRTARSSTRLLGGGGGVCLSACWDTAPSLGVDLETPWPDPITSPLGVGLETEFLTHASKNIILPQLRWGE